MKSSEIRTRFLKYFERNGHTIVPSSPLVPGSALSITMTLGLSSLASLIASVPSLASPTTTRSGSSSSIRRKARQVLDQLEREDRIGIVRRAGIFDGGHAAEMSFLTAAPHPGALPRAGAGALERARTIQPASPTMSPRMAAQCALT